MCSIFLSLSLRDDDDDGDDDDDDDDYDDETGELLDYEVLGEVLRLALSFLL